MYIVLQSLVNRQVSIQSERTIPLGAIKYVSTSSLKDDWFSLGVSSPQEADPLINCVFKTEFFTQLKMAMPGGPSLKISEVIEYNKKPGKPSTVKTVKDPSVARDDYYKSGTIHTGPGEPPNSVSKRTPKPKQVAGKPITSGKLLKPGGPGGAPGKLSSRPSSSRPIPQPPSSQRNTVHPRPTPAPPSAVPQPAISKARPVPQPLAAVNGVNHSRNDSASSITRAPPPPPPPTAALPAVQKDTYRALYDFPGQSDIELHVAKDEIIEVVRKEPNGRTLSFNRVLCMHFADLICYRLVAHQEARWLGARLGAISIPHGRSRQTDTPTGAARRSFIPFSSHKWPGRQRVVSRHTNGTDETHAACAPHEASRRAETGPSAGAPGQRGKYVERGSRGKRQRAGDAGTLVRGWWWWWWETQSGGRSGGSIEAATSEYTREEGR